MKTSVASVLKLALEIAWRRRYLLIIPLLVALPLSIVAGKYIPKTYQATSLMLMQENDNVFKLGERDNQLLAGQLRVKVAGLEALLKSERVLSQVLVDVMGADVPTEPRARAIAMKEIANALSLELVGTDFLEFRLRDTDPSGLGRKLEAITTRFLESLLLPDEETMSAPRMVLETSRRELAAARQAYGAFAERLTSDPLIAIRGRLDEREALQARIANQTLELDAAELRVRQARDELRAIKGDDASSAGIQAIGEARANTGSTTDTVAASETTVAARVASLEAEARAAEAMIDTLRSDIDGMTRQLTQLDTTLESLIAVRNERDRLQGRLRVAQERAERFERRFSSNTGTQSLAILKAPERIKVIDPPKDPEVPLISGLKFFLATLMAGILLGFGLTALAEIFDQSLRRSEEIEAATGLPVIARLPRSDVLPA